ncbi:4'-phosphopantetheine phosphatase-like [Tubulanus polymorphus]|uniref:4'-phosphopantetheine phosphatase-like n=1 Tax=Tubulanus polymorphus TaxID=672921 RepID=UPI003DA51953
MATAAAKNVKKFFNEEELELPLAMPKGKKLFSYDMGGSLFKLAYIVNAHGESKTKVKMVTFDNNNLEDALNFIEKEIFGDTDRKDIIAIGSGVGSRTYKNKMADRFKIKDIKLTDEFVCFGKGFHYMLKNMDESQYVYPYTDIPVPTRAEMGMGNVQVTHVTEDEEKKMRAKKDLFPALLGFCGSGMAFMILKEDGTLDMVGGTAMAGIAFHSIGRLLTGAKSYDELMDLAKKGDSTVCTTTIDDLSADGYADMDMKTFKKKAPFVFEVFAFGNIVRKGIENPKKEDIASSLLHLVGDSIMHTSMCIATPYKMNKVYYAGSFFKNNDIVKQYMTRLPMMTVMVGWPIHPRFLKFEGYVGVLGAVIDYLQSNK